MTVTFTPAPDPTGVSFDVARQTPGMYGANGLLFLSIFFVVFTVNDDGNGNITVGSIVDPAGPVPASMRPIPGTIAITLP